MSLPPGPSRSALRQTWWWVRDPLGFLDEMVGRYGHGTPFTMRRVGGMQLVMVSDPEHVKAVFHNHQVFLAGKAQAAVRKFLGPNSLIGIDGPQHKRHRRLMLPPFHGERMRAYGELMRDLTLQDIERWPLGQPLPMVEPLTRITLEIIFQAIFGVDDPVAIARLTELLHALTGKGRALVAYLPFLRVDLGPLSPWGRFKRLQAEFDAMVLEIIAKARANPEGREDILARMVVEGASHEDPLTDLEIRDELLTMLVAGHETTTSGLCWTLQWVLGLPEVKAKVLEEVREVVGEGPFDPARVGELRYLKAAIQEGLRLHAPIPSIGRYVDEDTELGGFALPKGSYACPVPHLTHRMPSLYPEPLRFQPERFLDTERRSPFEYYPFGGGIRMCIGMNFAMYEMQILLATILSRLELTLAGPPSHDGIRKALLVVPRSGTPVVAERLA